METFSSFEAKDFGPVVLNVTVDCPSCVNNTKKSKFWTVKHNYPASFPACASVQPYAMDNQFSSSPTLCRSTDNIADGTGVTVWIGNMSESGPRATVSISHGADGDYPLLVSNPFQFWQEKTVLLGLMVRRNKDQCFSSTDCSLTKQMYLASMQYDGKVDWGGTNWGGGQLNIRMLRFAQVYTKVRSQTLVEVLASIGGASGLILAALGVALKVTIFVFDNVPLKKQDKELPVISSCEVSSVTVDQNFDNEVWVADFVNTLTSAPAIVPGERNLGQGQPRDVVVEA